MKTDDPRVVLVTGCSEGGIGFHLCQELARSGCNVYATARSVEKMDGLDKNIHRLALDVNSDEAVASVVSTIIEREGRIDMLLNNAGVDTVRPLLDLPVSTLQATFNTNVFAVIRLAQAVVPHMAARSSGLIVNVSSISSFGAIPWAGAYSSSKAALTSLSDTLDMELRPLGVRVTLLEPGLIRTRLSEKINAEEACPKETSLYRPFTASILARTRFVDNTSSVPVDQFAQETVKALLRDNPPRYMSIGGQVRQVHLLQWLPRSWRLDLTWWKFSREK